MKQWLKDQRVRVYLHTVFTAITGLLVARGIVTSDDVALWGAVLVAVLGFPVTELVQKQTFTVNQVESMTHIPESIHSEDPSAQEPSRY